MCRAALPALALRCTALVPAGALGRGGARVVWGGVAGGGVVGVAVLRPSTSRCLHSRCRLPTPASRAGEKENLYCRAPCAHRPAAPRPAPPRPAAPAAPAGSAAAFYAYDRASTAVRSSERSRAKQSTLTQSQPGGALNSRPQSRVQLAALAGDRYKALPLAPAEGATVAAAPTCGCWINAGRRWSRRWTHPE